MTVSRERARSLLAPSVPAGEQLAQVTVARFPTSVARVLLLLLGLPCVLVAVIVAVGVNGRDPAVTGAITAGVIAVMVLAVWLLRRAERACVVGLTAERLLVAPLAGRTGLRITEVWEYPLARLRSTGVKSRFLNTGAAGTVQHETGRIEIADPAHPVRIDFPPSLMADNPDIYRTIRDAVTPEAA